MARHHKKLSKTQKERLKQIGKWVGLSSLAYESFMLFVWQRQHKRDVFNLALQRQAATKKKMLVIGDPGGDPVSRIFGNDYDCADLCIDPRGCASCANVLAKPVDEALTSLGDGQYIVYVSPGILEHVPDMLATMQALKRVSGGDLFIAHKNPWTLLSLLGKRRIISSPPTQGFTEWRDLPWLPGPSSRQRLDGLGYNQLVNPGTYVDIPSRERGLRSRYTAYDAAVVQPLRGLGAIDTKSLLPMALTLGVGGAFVGFQFGHHKALPALAGAAAGTAVAAMIVKSQRAATIGA